MPKFLTPVLLDARAVGLISDQDKSQNCNLFYSLLRKHISFLWLIHVQKQSQLDPK